MDLAMLTELFSSVGLPIALIAVLIYTVYQMGKRIVEQTDKNIEQIQTRSKEREETLMVEIKETREVNSKAIDTIGRYAEKLDNIQSDVKEIKQDINLIMMNGGNHQ